MTQALSAASAGDPQVCEAVVAALPQTGASLTTGVLTAGLILLLVGGVTIVLATRRRRGVSTLAAVALLAIATGTAVFLPAPSAHAAGDARVDYSDGCTLISVDQVRFTEQAARLLPGDDAPAIDAVVTNEYDAPISVSGTATIEDPATADALTVAVAFESTTDAPVTLEPGQSTPVTVTVTVPTTTDDTAQNLTSPLTLVLTAAEAP
ncbi:hypothetical protein BHE97_11470 [Aeromicrobium sp. PE09-221]|uniref:LPXTG cell wall anchor domain-containing protein n=1 Tax=Aeromicrobium sp. PE09-221 TaxID=1898043 RepID=UPI000B3E7527|nr:LPXTG cell wall anchor domain-containing protein [Aeromicrobium sp. PE09-221]OUZ09115.1 hypothetical protein BHE97_11470 [Aeromicrobium sp. PE09-221]